MKHVICYSGGHSSALTEVEVVRKYGKEDVILLNHNIIQEAMETEEYIGHCISKQGIA